MKLKQKTVIFGFGAMGSALAKGWIQSKLIPASRITVVEVDVQKGRDASRKLGIKASADPAAALKKAGLVILAVKPQQMRELLEESGSLFPKGALVVSI